MRQASSGRWVPDRPQKSSPDGDDTGLGMLQARARAAIAAGVVMPETWPVILFWAEAGRQALKERSPS